MNPKLFITPAEVNLKICIAVFAVAGDNTVFLLPAKFAGSVNARAAAYINIVPFPAFPVIANANSNDSFGNTTLSVPSADICKPEPIFITPTVLVVAIVPLTTIAPVLVLVDTPFVPVTDDTAPVPVPPPPVALKVPSAVIDSPLPILIPPSVVVVAVRSGLAVALMLNVPVVPVAAITILLPATQL